MKKSILVISLLSGTVLMYPDITIASGIPNTTHTSTLELKPASLLGSFKTASICFLGVGDCDPNIGFGKGDDYSSDTVAQCLNEGFSKQNCSSVQIVDGVCPYNPAYGLRCKCKSGLMTCPAGQVGVGEACNGQYASCKCDPALVSCASNQNGVGASCGGKYQSCTCKPEYKFTSSNCTSPRYVTGASCSGKYTGCSCPGGVSSGSYGCAEYYPSPCSSACKRAYTACEIRTAVSAPYGCRQAWSDCASKCQIGYTACEVRAAASCAYGCASYWSDCSSKCQSCKGNPCDSVTAVSVPANASCSAYHSSCSSKCSSWKCYSGYKQSGSSCVLANPCSGYQQGLTKCNYPYAVIMMSGSAPETLETCSADSRYKRCVINKTPMARFVAKMKEILNTQMPHVFNPDYWRGRMCYDVMNICASGYYGMYWGDSNKDEATDVYRYFYSNMTADGNAGVACSKFVSQSGCSGSFSEPPAWQ